MASVSTTNKINSASTVRGYGGLVSGLDRDSLIEGMTSSTRAKIAKQSKSRQTTLWKQEAYQSVSSKLVEFSKKYMSYTTPATNLSSASLWASSSVTTNGTNGKYVSVTGSSSISNSLSIVGVKEMAQDAYKVTNGTVSDSIISSGDIKFEAKDVSNLEGEYLTFKYGGKTFNVTMQTGEDKDGKPYDYSDAEKAAESINRSLEQVSIGDGKTLASVINVSAYVSGDVTKLDMKLVKEKAAGNSIWIENGSESALKALGFKDISKDSADVREIKETGFSETVKGYDQELTTSKDFSGRTKDKSISFTYNGVTKSVKLGENANIDDIAKDLKDKLAKQFGEGRIDVSAKGGKLIFRTTIAGKFNDDGTAKDDTTSVLSISSADKGILGINGELGVKAGESNRLNLESSIEESGLKGMADLLANESFVDGKMDLVINTNTTITINKTDSMKTIMNKINSSDAGVKVSYLSGSDKFMFESTVAGASGKVELSENAKTLFSDNDADYKGFKEQEGKDAIVSVKYGNGEAQDLVRSSNSFNLEGLNITVNGKFDGSADPVTLTAKTNSDKIVSTITDMIKDFNEIVQLVSDQSSKKPNRDYSPLTDEQKESMTEDQIKKWEDKAKVGVLFNDTELRSLSDSLRFVFDAGSDEKAMLSSFGITTSSDYTEKGKLVFDETKFRAALEKNPEDIKKLFTKKADTSTGEKDGFMAKLTSITNKFASTSGAIKGSLIEKAGSVYAPTSVTSNSLQKSIDSIDVYIKKLQAQLKTETDRYVKQFTNLENVIAQMNSQSSTLSSFGS
jgi:flagellar hook-associated protein 2